MSAVLDGREDVAGVDVAEADEQQQARSCGRSDKPHDISATQV
jgi:hypothetical protein